MKSRSVFGLSIFGLPMEGDTHTHLLSVRTFIIILCAQKVKRFLKNAIEFFYSSTQPDTFTAAGFLPTRSMRLVTR